MRQLASVVGSLGLVVAAWVALAPVSIDVPADDGRCGPPLVRYAAQESSDDPNEQTVIDRCEDRAAGRLITAGVAVGVGAVGFAGARLAARRHDTVEARRRRARRLQEEDVAERAAEYQARVEEAAARDAALRG